MLGSVTITGALLFAFCWRCKTAIEDHEYGMLP
jgi:hypothetical protein